MKAVAKDSAKHVATSYIYDEDAIQLYVMVVTLSKGLKISELKSLISNFNTKNFSTANLTISNVYLDNTRQMITINNFPDKEKAMLYYDLLKKDPTVFAKLKPADYKQFIISVDDYPKMYKNKDIDKYFLFFTKNYLQ